jgi:hypothetical protein
MADNIRQFVLGFLGIGTFASIFYLVFRENKRFMIIFLIGLGALIAIILLIGLILRVRDNLEAKKTTRLYKEWNYS